MADTDSAEFDRQQLLELLPLAANQTLPPAQQAALMKGLARHPELQHELRWLQALRQTVQDMPLDPLPGSDLGWSRFEARITADGTRRPARTARRRPPQGWAERLRDWMQDHFTPVLATACALLVAQTVLIGSLLRQDATYQPAGAPEQVERTPGSVLLHVTVRPGTTELALRQTLQRFNAGIVQGPTALGIYTLRVVDGTAPPADARQVAQRLMRDAADVFESTSPAEGE